MHFTSALVVISLSFTNCFVFYKDEVLGLKNYMNEINNEAQVSEEWIEQPLDHFNANSRTWKMRYFKRLDFWKPNGPIYVYINGESQARPDSLKADSNLVCQLASETKGALFGSEHRYYGKSMPANTKDASSMKYLSSKQALADIAGLIKSIKSAPEFKSSKVVVVGGSYAGNLAAWMRVLYPDLVNAAVSSSAPVLAKKDFYEYYETVSDVYEKYGSTDCLNKIKTMFNHFNELLKTPSGIEGLKKEMNICDETDMSVKENQNFFISDAMNFFGGYAQYGSPAVIKLQCKLLQTNNWAQAMYKAAEISRKQLTSQYRNIFKLNYWTSLSQYLNGVSRCLDYDFTSNIKLIKADSHYSWLYQTCTEFGYYATSNSKKETFAHNLPLDFYIKLCQSLYGKEFNEKRVDDGVAQTNAIYGGITPNVTNVVFTHGDMDPWHRLGVLEDLSDTAVVRITNATSHCAVLDSPQLSDPKALAEDREYVKSMITKWIKKV